MEYNEKQIAIINTAEKLFSMHGFEGTSVRDISQEAGINVAMISYYFGSKEKLMEAIFEERTMNLRMKVENLMANATMTNLEKVNVLIDDYVERFMHQQLFHKLMIREQVVENNTPVAVFIYELKKRNLGSIKKLIHEGQKSGEFRKNVDVMLMMATLVGTVSQMVTSQKFCREVYSLESMPEQEYQRYIKKKLSAHLKNLFKLSLANEK